MRTFHSLNKIVKEVIYESDIVLEILDARFIDEMRNFEVEKKVQELKKPLIFVFNKCDLADKKQMEAKKKDLKNSVFISSKDRMGTKILIDKIKEIADGLDPNRRTYHKSFAPEDKKIIIVGLVGYPNTGKSSVINILKGRKVAESSPHSGYTKAKKLIKITQDIYLMDTPGILRSQDIDKSNHVLVGAMDVSKIKDPEPEALRLMRTLDGKIEKFYGVEKREEALEALEEIAKKFNRYRKGGVPDTEVISRKIIQDWQRGKIKA